MRDNKKIIVILCCISAIICLLSAGAYSVISLQEMTRMEMEGNVLIQNVEAFYKRHDRLPEDSELQYGKTEHSIGPFYEKTSEVTYSIYFCLGFDRYYMYESNNKKWHYFPRQTTIQTMLQRIRML